MSINSLRARSKLPISQCVGSKALGGANGRTEQAVVQLVRDNLRSPFPRLKFYESA